MAFECNIPALPTVQRDDDDVRITRWDFSPGAVTGWHTHGWPYFVVMLTDAIMRVHDGTNVTETRMAAGQAYNRPAGVQHDVMNGSDNPMAFVEIEVKRPPGVPPG
jgi:quercetin dioxygenase-like cupin family protein